MTLLGDLFDLNLAHDMLDSGYVRMQTHPTQPLGILNYTEKAAYERVWNPVTLQCRGLIYDTETGEVVARPFRKFFNLGEPDTHVPTGHYWVMEKMDGSLGIIYPTPDGPAVATRGSFTSDQALWATGWLRRTYPSWRPERGQTYLAEIVYPQNRIVVDYGAYEGLVLLDRVNIATGFGEGPWEPGWPGDRVTVHESREVSDLANDDRPNHEGYVLYWPDEDYRLKIKHNEYVRLHKIITNCTARTVWEYLSSGRGTQELLDSVPDEFYDWVRKTASDLQDQVEVEKAEANLAYRQILRDLSAQPSRKQFAEAAKAHAYPYKALLFRLLDGQALDGMVWKMIKPEAEKPFSTRSVT